MSNDFDLRAQTWEEDFDRVVRARVIANEIKEQIPLTKEMKGLEFGCGTGLLSLNLHTELETITLVDDSEGMIEVLWQKISENKISNMIPLKTNVLEGLPTDERYDLIFSLLTLHHILDTKNILNVLYAHLKQGGYLCIVDIDEEDGSFHQNEAFQGHNGFNRIKLAKTFKQCGFSNVRHKICYERVKKLKDGSLKAFPLFIMIAQRIN